MSTINTIITISMQCNLIWWSTVNHEIWLHTLIRTYTISLFTPNLHRVHTSSQYWYSVIFCVTWIQQSITLWYIGHDHVLQHFINFNVITTTHWSCSFNLPVYACLHMYSCESEIASNWSLPHSISCIDSVAKLS